MRRIVVYDDGGDGIDGCERHPVELAFFEVAVETMIELDRVFKAEAASYMEFPRVRGIVLEALARRMGARVLLVVRYTRRDFRRHAQKNHRA